MLFTRHYYEKVYLKVLADWPLLLMVLLYGKEMKESCAYSEPFLKEKHPVPGAGREGAGDGGI